MKNVCRFMESVLPSGGTVLVALSGGMDSMCLTHFLHAQGVPLVAAHFNHHLRGAESDEDETFVRRWCEENGIRLIIDGFDVASEAKRRGQSVEETARDLRYAFLERAAREAGAVRIATAHHAQDCAETMLFHLLRGTGADGLGIPAVRGTVIRPLLYTPHSEIERYVEAHRIPYRTDSTNADPTYTRNYLRREVFPLLAKVNGAAAEHMAEASRRILEESAYLDSLAEEHLQGLRICKEEVFLPCVAIKQAPQVLRGRMVRLLLDRLPVGKRDYTAAHYEAILDLALGAPHRLLDLPHGVCASCDGETLTLHLSPTPPDAVRLTEDTPAFWGNYTIFVEKNGENRCSDDAIFLLGCDTIREKELTVSAWHPQDRLTLPDTAGARSLKRLFADAGIVSPLREQIPVLRVDGRAAAVYGIGTDAAYLPAATKKNTLTVRIRKA